MSRSSTTARLRNSLAPGIAALAQREGCSTTRYPGVVVWRMTVAQPPTPTLYAASLILVGSGEKQATLGDESFVYNADHLLVVTSPIGGEDHDTQTLHVQPILESISAVVDHETKT